MVCCTLLAGLLALILRPLSALRGNPLAWRLDRQAVRPVLAPIFGARSQSFVHAIAGIGYAVRHEPNMRIHLGAAMLAVLAGMWFDIAATDWRWLILAIGLVLAAEALNTAVEQCCNAVSREYNPAIKAAKDVAAGAVLICASCAALIGFSVFVPYLAIASGPAQPSLHTLICGGNS